MNGEEIPMITEILQNLTVDQQLFGHRILYRKLLIVDKPLNQLR